MLDAFYDSPEWRELRDHVKQRDGSRCTVARLLGGDCSAVLHVHHIEKADERPDLALSEGNCATVCARHHPTWESLRAWLIKVKNPLPPCRHKHPYRAGRIACENERRKRAGLPPVEDRQFELV